MVTIDDSNHRTVDSKIVIECDVKSSKKCRGIYPKAYRDVIKTRSKHNGKDVCIFCHNKSFGSGKNNGAFRHYKDITFFESIDSEIKAYLLGLIAGDGSIEKTGKRIVLYANSSDVESLELFRKNVSPTSPIINDNGCFNVRINSTKIVFDICHHLKINPGSKHEFLSLPNLEGELKWSFIRGLIDSDGSISDPSKGCSSPRCKLTSNSIQLLKDIRNICNKNNINSCLDKKNIYFTGKHAYNFMSKIYKSSNYHLSRKFSRFCIWDTWSPGHGTIIRPRKNSTLKELCV